MQCRLAEIDSWMGQFGTRHDDDDARPLLREERVTPRGERAMRPFPPRRTGEYRKGMILARPLYQGVRRSVWDPETSRKWIGDWPSCVLPNFGKASHKAKWRVEV
jgi:hypothetical protein